MSVSTTFRVIGQAGKRGIALHASKRGIARKFPAGEKLLGEIRSWLETEYRDMVHSAAPSLVDSGEARLAIGFYPAGSPVLLEVNDEGHVALEGETAGVGPGYQRFLARVAERLGVEMDIEWRAADSRPIVDGRIGVDRPTVERAHLTWLGTTLVGARDARRIGAGGMPIGLPPDLRIDFDGAIATPLGPRDDAWLERALGDVPTAIDIVPWWVDATDARYHLNRALCLMWVEVRWRRPATAAEREVQDEVLRILRRGVALDPSLPWPWPEWHELNTIRSIGDPVTSDVAARAAAAAQANGSRVPVGYRRGEVLVVHEGWALRVPGSFDEKRTPEEWTGGDASRSITLAGVETGTRSGPMSATAFLDQVAEHLGSDVITRDDGLVLGRARITTDGSSGVEVGVLEGYAAVRGRGAAIRITFKEASDWQWAVDMWRALRPA
jgi:hypothetical protein